MAIVEVTLHQVGFTLEIEVVVGFHKVMALGIAPQPLYAVPEEKTHEQHLALLEGVNIFMIFLHLIQPPFVASTKDQAEDISSIETAKGEIFVVD